MSSHHFVREFQEPAVYFHSLSREDMDQIGALLEWAPYVIAHERCLRLLEEAHVKVDALIHLEASASTHPDFTDENIKFLHLADEEEVQKLLFKLLPKESVGIHVVDTMANFHPSVLRSWPAGFALLYHPGHRFMQVKASGYSKWWPQGTLLKLLLLEPETGKIHEEREITTKSDGMWECPYEADKVTLIGEPY